MIQSFILVLVIIYSVVQMDLPKKEDESEQQVYKQKMNYNENDDNRWQQPVRSIPRENSYPNYTDTWVPSISDIQPKIYPNAWETTSIEESNSNEEEPPRIEEPNSNEEEVPRTEEPNSNEEEVPRTEEPNSNEEEAPRTEAANTGEIPSTEEPDTNAGEISRTEGSGENIEAPPSIVPQSTTSANYQSIESSSTTSGSYQVVIKGQVPNIDEKDDIPTSEVPIVNEQDKGVIPNQNNEEKQEETTFQDICNSRGGDYTLTQNEVIEGDLYWEQGCLDLNGYTLEVTGNIYQPNGKILINKGKLIVNGTYHLGQRIDTDYKPGKLILKNPEDQVYVKGDMNLVINWLVYNEWCAGEIHLGGDFNCETVAINQGEFFVHSTMVMILEGSAKQGIYIACDEVKLPKIEIKGNTPRDIEIFGRVSSEGKSTFMIESIESQAENHIFLQGAILLRTLYLEESLCLYGNCEIADLNLEGHRLVAQGNLAIRQVLRFKSGQLIVNGDMKFKASDVKMESDQDILQIDGDLVLKLPSNKGLYFEQGTLIIGGNIEQSGSAFETNKNVVVILLGNTPSATVIKGSEIILGQVILEKEEEDYVFGENVTYQLTWG